jgi:hypothetical protein
MHQEATTCSPAEDDDRIDGAILGLLIDSPVPWSVLEVEREIGDEIATADGLARLARAGLIHRFDGFVFATRTAARAAAVYV